MRLMMPSSFSLPQRPQLEGVFGYSDLSLRGRGHELAGRRYCFSPE